MKERIAFLDVMRVIACFMVIMIHSCEFFFIDDNNIGIQNMRDGFWVSVIDSAFRCSVPLFVMISSFLLVPVKTDTRVFFHRRLLRVVVPFTLWSIFYATLPYLWGDMTATGVMESISHLAYNFNASSGHMWFVYMLIGLYLFMPIISPWLEKTGKNGELCFLTLWFISSFFPYVRNFVGEIYGECYWNEYNMLWYFSGFMGYVVLAHYIRHHLQWTFKKSIGIGTMLYIIGYCVTALIWYNRIPTATTLQELELSWRFCTPNVILMSFGAFIVIQSIFSMYRKGNRIVNEISILSYGIYLMHIFVLEVVHSQFKDIFPTQWTIILVGTVTFVICCIITKIISFLPFSKYIIG